ncbi:MAG: hypothetical protein ACJA0B_000756 [Alcanivorax borkumensis]|jgi:hypothetical protein
MFICKYMILNGLILWPFFHHFNVMVGVAGGGEGS